MAVLGAMAFLVGLVWLRYLLSSSKDMAVSLSLVIGGLGVVILGSWLSKWAQSRRSASSPNPQQRE